MLSGALAEARRGCWILWSRSNRQLGATQHGRWELSLVPGICPDPWFICKMTQHWGGVSLLFQSVSPSWQKKVMANTFPRNHLLGGEDKT